MSIAVSLAGNHLMCSRKRSMSNAASLLGKRNRAVLRRHVTEH